MYSLQFRFERRCECQMQSRAQRLSVIICDLLCWVCSLFLQLSLHNIISPVYEVSCDSSLKNEFSIKNLNTFWLGVKAVYPILSELAMAALLPFVITYLCESAFSTLTSLITKHSFSLKNIVLILILVTSIE